VSKETFRFLSLQLAIGQSLTALSQVISFTVGKIRGNILPLICLRTFSLHDNFSSWRSVEGKASLAAAHIVISLEQCNIPGLLGLQGKVDEGYEGKT